MAYSTIPPRYWPRNSKGKGNATKIARRVRPREYPGPRMTLTAFKMPERTMALLQARKLKAGRTLSQEIRLLIRLGMAMEAFRAEIIIRRDRFENMLNKGEVKKHEWALKLIDDMILAAAEGGGLLTEQQVRMLAKLLRDEWESTERTPEHMLALKQAAQAAVERVEHRHVPQWLTEGRAITPAAPEPLPAARFRVRRKVVLSLQSREQRRKEDPQG